MGFPAAHCEQLAFNITSTEITTSSISLFSGNPTFLRVTRLSEVFRWGK